MENCLYVYRESAMKLLCELFVCQKLDEILHGNYLIINERVVFASFSSSSSPLDYVPCHN